MTLLATATATNVLLGVLAFNLLIAAFLYVQDVRDRHRFPPSPRQKMYVPPEWMPEQDDDDIDLQVWR